VNRFYIPKLEGDYSDILVARGVGELIKLVLDASGKRTDIYMVNSGQFYLLESTEDITEEDFDNISFKILYPLIYYDKMPEKPAYVGKKDLIDYTEEEKYEDWSSDKRKSSFIRQATGIPLSNRIMDDLYSIKEHFNKLVSLILSFYSEIHVDYEKELEERLNKFYEDIQLANFKERIKGELPEEYGELLDKHFMQINKYNTSVKKQIQNFATENGLSTKISREKIDNYFEECKIKISKKHNALSCLLPGRVKGLNFADLSAGTRISPKNISENWIKLYLIIIGFYKSFIFRTLRSGNRLYTVIEPQMVNINNFDSLYEEIEPKYYPTDTIEKQNVLYLCNFIIKLLDKLDEFDKVGVRRQRKNRAKDYINGLKNVYLVNMGHQKYVIKSIYDLNIPNWLALDEEKDKDAFKLLFQEFIDLVEPINDKTEDIKLFQELDAFLSTEKIEHLLNYYYYHATLAMQRLASNKRARIYSKRSVEFIMSKLEAQSGVKYGVILNRQGFKNFARAIRNSTLVPIYLKDKKSVKFGLLQEIRKAALNKNTLLVKLSEFMSDYNNENGLEAFRYGKQMRANLTTKDFEDIVELIDEYDSKIIGNMLLAYGFAKDEKIAEIENVEMENMEKEEEVYE